MKTNNRVLQEIGYQIKTGNPLWGLLFMNEYLPTDCWLRQAFITSFRSRWTDLDTTPLITKLLAGATAQALSEDERTEVGARVVPSARNYDYLATHRPAYRRDATAQLRRAATRA
jgi:hypothetical protein